jgi:hypothetical protein
VDLIVIEHAADNFAFAAVVISAKCWFSTLQGGKVSWGVRLWR